MSKYCFHEKDLKSHSAQKCSKEDPLNTKEQVFSQLKISKKINKVWIEETLDELKSGLVICMLCLKVN